MDSCGTCIHTPPKSVGGHCAGCDPSDPKYSLYEERQHQTGRKPDMDLKETVAAAKEEGLSYGEYVTKHSPPVTVDVPKDPEPSAGETKPAAEPQAEGLERICPYCKKTFRVYKTMSRQKYCSPFCQQQAQYARQKKRNMEKAKAQPAEKPAETVRPEKRSVTFGDILNLLGRGSTEVELRMGDDNISGAASNRLWKRLEPLCVQNIGADGDGLIVWLGEAKT